MFFPMQERTTKTTKKIILRFTKGPPVWYCIIIIHPVEPVDYTSLGGATAKSTNVICVSCAVTVKDNGPPAPPPCLPLPVIIVIIIIVVTINIIVDFIVIIIITTQTKD